MAYHDLQQNQQEFIFAVYIYIQYSNTKRETEYYKLAGVGRIIQFYAHTYTIKYAVMESRH